MPGNVNTEALNTGSLNSGSVFASFSVRAAGVRTQRAAISTRHPGTSRQFEIMATLAPGLGRVAVRRFTARAPGARRQLYRFGTLAPGLHGVSIISVSMRVVGATRQYRRVATLNPGASVSRFTVRAVVPGAARMQTGHSVRATGASKCGLGHTTRVVGAHAVALPTHTRVYRQGYRVAEADRARWELYLGYGAEPDFDDVGQPVATSTTSPITFMPTLPGAGLTTVLHYVVRRRNQYNLLGHNMDTRRVEIDENGNEVQGPITPPELTRLLDGFEIGALQVWARYAHGPDRNPADTWELYAKEDSDPVVGVDTPLATAAMGVHGGANIPWRTNVDGLNPGGTYHVIVVVRRGNDDAYEESAVGTITLAAVYDIDEGQATIFGGEEYVSES